MRCLFGESSVARSCLQTGVGLTTKMTHLQVVEGGIPNRHDSIAPQKGGQLPPETRPIEILGHHAIRQPHEHFRLACLQILSGGGERRRLINSLTKARLNFEYYSLTVSPQGFQGFSPASFPCSWLRQLDEVEPWGAVDALTSMATKSPWFFLH